MAIHPGTKMNGVRRSLLACLFCLCGAGGAFAQDEHPAAAVHDSLRASGFPAPPRQNTFSAHPDSAIRAPASLSIVSRETFEVQGSVSLSEALQNFSGVNVQANLGVHDFFLVRGFDSLQDGMILVDGAPEIESTFYSLYNVERLELLKGPATYRYGGNPLWGVVNLVRKQPDPKKSGFLQATGTLGRFSTIYGALDFGAALPAAGLAFRMNAMRLDADNYRDDKQSRQYAFNPAIAWRPGDRLRLEASFEAVRNDGRPDAGLPILIDPTSGEQSIPDVSRRNSYQTRFDDSDQTIYRGHLGISYRMSERARFSGQFYYVRQKWNAVGTLLFGAAANFRGDLEVTRQLQSLGDRQRIMGARLDFIYQYASRRLRAAFNLGLEFRRLDDDFDLRFSALSPVNMLNPVDTTPDILRILLLPFSAADAKQRTDALYFSGRITLFGRWLLFAGGRFDFVDYDDRRFDYDFATLQNVLGENARNDRQFNPLLATQVRLSTGISLYTNAARAFAPPSPRLRGDAEPEIARQVESGVSVSLAGNKLRGRLAYYRFEKSEIAIPAESGLLVQNGKQRARGVELEVHAAPGFDVSFDFVYAFNEAEHTVFRDGVQTPQDFRLIDRAGRRLPFAPKHLLHFWLTRPLGTHAGIGFGGRFIDAQFVAANNQFRLEPVLLFNATAYLRWRNLTWRVNFKNLTDREYELRGFQGASIIPANPFELSATLEISL